MYFKTSLRHIGHDVNCKVSSLVYELVCMCKCPFVTTNKHQVITVSSPKNGKKRENNPSVSSASLSAEINSSPQHCNIDLWHISKNGPAWLRVIISHKSYHHEKCRLYSWTINCSILYWRASCNRPCAQSLYFLVE